MSYRYVHIYMYINGIPDWNESYLFRVDLVPGGGVDVPLFPTAWSAGEFRDDPVYSGLG